MIFSAISRGKKGPNGWSFDKILGLLISLPVWKRHFRTTSGRTPQSSVDVQKLGLPHPGHYQSGSNYSLKLTNNCTGSRINTEIVAKKWRKNLVLTHVAFDARGRGLGIFFWYQLIHLWKELTKTNQMPCWNALQVQKPRKKMGLVLVLWQWIHVLSALKKRK